MRKRDFLVADLFCGAGGSSTGAERAIKSIGGRLKLVCINHWPVAIETHKLNHPTAQHYVEDVMVADPVKLVPEGYLDLLMASPECRYYSRARGGRPVHDQGRMNPWVIQRWLTSLNVRCLLVENVPEFVDWGPLLKDGTPDPKHKGLYFQSWLKALWELGYKAEWKYLNAANYGDATTRIRFFLIARKDGKNIHFPEPTHSEDGEADMLGQLPKWRAAREIIDWSNSGRSLLDDAHYLKKPLSEKTRKRIARGLSRFGGPLAPLYIQLLGVDGGELPCTGRPEPYVMGKESSPSIRSTDEPVPGITTHSGPQFINPTLKPFVMGKQGHSPAYRGDDEPIPSVTTQGRSVIVNPTLVKYFGSAFASSVDKPVPTLTTKSRYALATPIAEPFTLGQHSGSAPRSAGKPIPMVMSDGAIALVNPVLVDVNHSGDDNRSRDIGKPLKTVTTKRGTGLIEPITVPIQAEGIDPHRLVLIDGQTFMLDIRFRMLTNLELARAMGFTDNETTYEFVGNIGQVTKQIGNAVPVNMAKALVTAILEG